MKVAKCCESKEPELLTFEQIKEREGVYQIDGHPTMRLIVVGGGMFDPEVLWFSPGVGRLQSTGVWEGHKFLRTSETLCVGLKDAAGKWVE